MRRAILALAICLSIVCQGTLNAQTTGGLTGTLTDSATQKPIAGATVTATSPSQTAKTTTGPDGHFVFLDLAPDNYTVSAQVPGLEPVSVTGVGVFTDQQATVTLRTTKPLREIGRVTSRARSDVVQPGTTTDVYTVTPATQNAAKALGGGGSLNQAYSALASVPGVYVPQGQSGIYQSVYLRGGDYTQIGYEFDGVPIQRAFDQYASTSLSSLGQQNLQVYAGSGPLDAQSSGLAGFINQTIKTGTNPGFVNVNFGLGSPTYYHHAEIEAGGATKNGLFSYYVATAGYNQEYRYFSQQNGAQLDSQFGTPYNIIQQNCGGLTATVGCYTNTAGIFNFIGAGPTGYALGPFSFDLQSQVASRDTVANLHFGIPHKDGTKDDIQLLYDGSFLRTFFQTAQNDWNYANANVQAGTATYLGANYQNCANVATGAACALIGGDRQVYVDRTIYNGPVGVPLTSALVAGTQQYYFPNSSYDRAPFADIPAAQRDTYDNRSGIEKVQYTKSLGANAFARIYGYSLYSDWLQNGANSQVINFSGGVSPDYELLAHTRGVVASFSDQVNAQNLINFNAGYTYASTVRWNNGSPTASPTVAYAVSSAHPAAGICYGDNLGSTVLTPVNCGASSFAYNTPPAGSFGLQQAMVTGLTPAGAPAGFTPATVTSPTVNQIGTYTCGGAPCEYLTTNNGISGTYNTVAPVFSNLAFEDKIHPTSKLLLSLGVHYDDFRYNLGDTNVPQGPEPNTATLLQRQFWNNAFLNSNCQSTTTLQLVTRTLNEPCPAGSVPVTFSTQSAASNDYHGFEPRFAATYTVDPFTVLRSSYSKVLQAASSAYQQYNGAQGQIPLQANFYPVGFRNPSHMIYPAASYNLDFSLEHQFKNTDTGFSLTPFYRSTDNEILSVVLDPKTNFVSGINVGKKYVEGAEFLLHKGSFDRDGIAAQLSYTYTYGKIHFDALPNGQSIIGPINTAIEQYNSYTSFCAGHGTDARCAAGTTSGQPAAPCYTTTGTAVAACGAGDVANPYWNSPVQNLFSENAFYTPYNQTPGAAVGDSNQSVTSSYIIPHVAALLLQYKHGPFRITPTVQFSAGGKYGSPLLSYGVDPATCTANLASIGSGFANDPRYTSGLPATATAGNAYLAQSCSGALFTPDRYTGGFDNFGQFTEPSNLVGNLALSYDISKRVTISATLVNIVDQCFGGGRYPWANDGPKVGCWYATPPTPYAGNFYNPGNTFQGSAAYPYGPTFGNTFQTAYGGQANPFQAFFSIDAKL